MDNKIFECNFNINAQIGNEFYEKFAIAKAQAVGIRGWIQSLSNGDYQGHLEGSVDIIEKMKQILQKSEEVVNSIKSVIFTELKELQKFTVDNFQAIQADHNQEGPTNMSTAKLYAIDFNIEANIPKEVFEAFALAQAKITGVRGWITTTAENVYKGHLEGSKEIIEKMQKLLQKSEQYGKYIKNCVFTELAELKNYTVENFQCKTV